MTTEERPSICVLSSTFPGNDAGEISAGYHWVYYLHRGLSDTYDFHVVAPRLNGTPRIGQSDGMTIHRFDFLGNSRRTSESGSIFLRLRRSPWSPMLLAVPFYLLSFYLAARKVLKAEKVRIIHAHWTVPAGLLALLLRKEFICSANGSDIRLTSNVPVLKSIIRFILHRASMITAIGPEVKERIVGLGIAPEKVVLLAQVIDTDLFNPEVDGSAVRRDLHLGNDPTVLFVGNLEPLKAPDNVIRAVAIVKQSLHGVRLVVVGQGSMRAQLQELVNELGMEDNVTFLGWVQPSEVARLLKAADVLAPTMKDVGIAGVQLESFAVGTPLISSVPDYFANFRKVVTGCDVSDYRDIADKILHVVSHRAEILDRMNKYRRQVLDEFSPKRRSEQLEGIYEAVLKPRREPGVESRQ